MINQELFLYGQDNYLKNSQKIHTTTVKNVLKLKKKKLKIKNHLITIQ